MMPIDGVCSQCGWRVPVLECLDLEGKEARLCRRCMAREERYRAVMAAIHARYAAQASQLKRLDRTLDWYAEAYAAALATTDGEAKQDG